MPPLDFLVQSHRFDIVRDFGPFASLHPSTPSIILIGLPPLFLCLASFLVTGKFLPSFMNIFSRTAGRSIHHSFRQSIYNFGSHIESRSTFTSSLFFRRAGTVLGLTGVLTIVNLFSMFSQPRLIPWNSVESVRAKAHIVKIVTQRDEVTMLKLSWWGIPATSIVYLLLAFTVGEETRDAAKWIVKTVQRGIEWYRDLSLSLPTQWVLLSF